MSARTSPTSEARRLCLLLLASCLTLAAPASAQSVDPTLGEQPFAHMHMLLEKTIFKVDVLTLDVCIDPGTARTVGRWAPTDGKDDAADSIAAAVIDAPTAVGTIRFRRGVSLGQFLDGIRDEQKKAVSAGLLDRSTFDMIGDSLPVWFGFLRERGIHEDDRITYVFSGDSLRTLFRDPDDDVLLDRTDVGRQRRTSVLATWFAPESAFRRPLLKSLDPAAQSSPVCSPEAE